MIRVKKSIGEKSKKNKKKAVLPPLQIPVASTSKPVESEEPISSGSGVIVRNDQPSTLIDEISSLPDLNSPQREASQSILASTSASTSADKTKLDEEIAECESFLLTSTKQLERFYTEKVFFQSPDTKSIFFV